MQGMSTARHAAASRRDFLKTAGAAALTAALAGKFPAMAQGARTGTRPPNILLIMADDLGVETLGAYGGESYHTPNLDRLAADGIRFDYCHSTPSCTPSRVNILTGRYGFRTGVEWGAIPPDEITFGHVLRDAGYATGLAGKWQLNQLEDDPEYVHRMGFDTYAAWAWHEGPRYWNPMVWQDAKLREDIAHRYGPEVFVEHLENFMLENRDRPFLAYYPMVLPHFAKPEGNENEEPVGPHGEYETYAEMVQLMDEMVGRIVRAVDGLGLREDTVILFTGDNGTPRRVTSVRHGQEVPGGKKTLLDTGTHVPLIARWPGTAPAGTVNTDLVDFSDFLPTLAELAGGVLPTDRPLDGTSFAAQLHGERGTPREWIYTEHKDEAWARTHDWKRYLDGRLIHMTQDPLEESPVPPEEDTPISAAARARLAEVLAELRG